MVEFNGEIYNDDRMFVMYICKGSVRNDGDLIIIITKIYHEKVPEDFIWCLVTYKNVSRYTAFRVDRFSTEEEAIEYLRKVEPTTPLISLNGKSLHPIPTYTKYLGWKQKNNFKEYNYKEMYLAGYINPTETFYEKRRI